MWVSSREIERLDKIAVEAKKSFPTVSVLMPTFRHASFIRRAIESLCAQTFSDWELVIVDDGSPDNTSEIVKPYLEKDARFRYFRLPRNQGLGAALNYATAQARGQFLAYLPSDDIYYPEHLEQLVQILKTQPQTYLAYGGVRWNYQNYGPTLRGEEWVGKEAEFLANPPLPTKEAVLPNGNLLAMVQVMHRREYEDRVRWIPRSEKVTDCLEPEFWRGLAALGAKFNYAGAVSCEWLDHPDQHHKLIARKGGGLSRYRHYYGIGQDEWLNWQPSRGWALDERARYERFRVKRDLPEAGGLKILLVGELGFNPERIMALEERGHKLYGLWTPYPEVWDTIGPLAYGNVEDIPYQDNDWKAQIKAIQPDVIYALLNWQALPLIYEVHQAKLNIPFVFHFKEGPFITQELGTWSATSRILQESEGQIFINQESFEWFQTGLDGGLNPDSVFILDGDLPKLDWFSENWKPKLSAQDGEIHTVCTGRPLGLDPFEAVAEAGIHVHFYGEFFQLNFPNWTRKGLATGYMHIHPAVEPFDWVRELSQYDAAWFHLFDSYNKGDLRRAHWDDLNLPARLGTYAAAGLPWILKDNRHSRVAVQRIAQDYDVGVYFSDFEDLAAQLRDYPRLEELNQNMRKARADFAFDTHADNLINFFRRAIVRHRVK